MPVWCLRRSIDPRGDPGRYCTASCLFDDTWRHSLTFLTLAVGTPPKRRKESRAVLCAISVPCARREIAPVLAYEARAGEV